MVIPRGPVDHLRDMPRMALCGLVVVSHLLHGINGFTMTIPVCDGRPKKCFRSDQYEGSPGHPKTTHLGRGVDLDH